ncbi:MAG: hypothetical protein ACREJV_05145 [Candidatus Rokuibacteriota bacterium]
MSQHTPICSVCGEPVALGVPVVFDHGEVVHLDCYTRAEGAATLVQRFLGSRPGERFCYTCLAQHLGRQRQEIQKAAIALRLTRSIVVAPAICSACTQARATIRAKPAADTPPGT